MRPPKHHELRPEPLIVEDLLLLLLDDRSGTVRGEANLHYTLGGAVLIELALLGRVELDGRKRVHAVAGEPLGDSLLDAAAAQVAKRARHVHTVLLDLGLDLEPQVRDRLVERGMLRRERSKVLGLIPVTRTPAQDLPYEAALLERVRAVLEDGVTPDPRTAALTAALSASGTLRELHPAIRRSRAVTERARELREGTWGAAEVDQAIVVAAIASVGGAVAEAAAGGDSSQ
ncbi:GPP34 family phosphoprotein [Promicromonospora sp. NPDC059942]|uniref:GOLPH3/VPS74 family protein n=1 Tax=Promicromonospora sp. NPDC059942 TaxID=3347009 RepID=UPI0036640EBA